jgi:hypothetical protein
MNGGTASTDGDMQSPPVLLFPLTGLHRTSLFLLAVFPHHIDIVITLTFSLPSFSLSLST